MQSGVEIALDLVISKWTFDYKQAPNNHIHTPQRTLKIGNLNTAEIQF